MERTARDRIWNVVRGLLMTVSIVVGFLMVALAVVLGDCSAFGGRCPAEAPSLWDDDVVGMSGLGAALMVGPAVFLTRPCLRRLWIAIGAAACAGVLAGFIARSIAHG